MWTAELRGRMQDIMQSNAAVFRTGSVLKVRKNFFDFGVVFSSDLFFFFFQEGVEKIDKLYPLLNDVVVNDKSKVFPFVFLL